VTEVLTLGEKPFGMEMSTLGFPPWGPSGEVQRTLRKGKEYLEEVKLIFCDKPVWGDQDAAYS